MSFYLQVLSTDGIDSSACIVVFTESHRFLFNCGEGIQRLCVEHKVRLSKIRAVMFSDFSPRNVFGLPGLALTAADAGNNNIRVAGPPLLKSFLHTTRHFMKLPDGLLNFHSSAEQSSCIFNSSEVDLRTICFETGSPAMQHNCFVGRTPELKGKFDLLKAHALKVPKGPLFGKLKNGQSITLADGTVITPEQVLGESELCKYFVVVCSVLPHEEELLKQITHNAELNRFHTGQVDAQTGGELKCMVHLSPAATVNTALYQNWVTSFGPSVTHLYTGAGTSVTTHSSFVATTTTCNKMHLTTPYLFPTMHTVYTGLYNAGENNNNSGTSGELDLSTNHVNAVPLLKFHLLPVRNQGVELPVDIDCSALATALYQEVTNEHAENATSVKEALAQMEVVKGVLTKHITNATTNSTTTANATTAMHMDTRTAAVDTPINATLSEGIETLYGVHTSAASQLLQSGVDGIISLLGTGCSIPSKYRNVSGILLQINNGSDSNSDSSRNTSGESYGDSEVRSLLIDAGEGTWAQMQRLAYEAAMKAYNTSITGTNTLPTLHSVKYTLSSQLRVIWVSHPHADHHLGLVRVIMERKTALLTHNATSSTRSNISDSNSDRSGIVEPVVVIAPPSVLAFLHEYSLLNPFMQDAYIGVSCRAYDPDDSCVYTDCYWNKCLVEGNDRNSSERDRNGSSGDKDKTEETEEQEHKRKRSHSPDKHTPVSNNTILPTNSTTPTTIADANTAITASAEQSTAIMKPDDLPHKKHTHGDSGNANHPKKTTKGFQYFIDTSSAATEDTTSVISTTVAAVTSAGSDMISDMLTDTTNSTICGMNEVNTIISATTTTTTATSTAAATNGKTWRNFKHIFKEKIPSEVLALAAEAKDKADTVLHKMGIVELTNVQVVHCGQSYGLSVTIVPTSASTTTVDTTTATMDANDIMVDDNTAATTTVPTSTTSATTATAATTATKAFKLVYSGDTRPCPRLIEIGTDATILIHEATFEDTKQEEAIMKRHSTMCEAYQVGVEMNAFRTIFTHFSQRYPGVPLLAKYAPVVTLSENSESNTDNSSGIADNMLVTTADDTVKDTILAAAELVDPILAFDYMQLSFADMLWAPASTAVFSAAFPGKTTISKGGEADEE